MEVWNTTSAEALNSGIRLEGIPSAKAANLWLTEDSRSVGDLLESPFRCSAESLANVDFRPAIRPICAYLLQNSMNRDSQATDYSSFDISLCVAFHFGFTISPNSLGPFPTQSGRCHTDCNRVIRDYAWNILIIPNVDKSTLDFSSLINNTQPDIMMQHSSTHIITITTAGDNSHMMVCDFLNVRTNIRLSV